MTGALAVIVPVLMAVIFTKAGLDMVRDGESMRTTAARLGIDQRQFGVIGGFQLLGAVGMLIGLAWAPLGVAAASGLGLLMLGALAAHLRVSDPLAVAAPAVCCLAGAVGSGMLFLI